MGRTFVQMVEHPTSVSQLTEKVCRAPDSSWLSGFNAANGFGKGRDLNPGALVLVPADNVGEGEAAMLSRLSEQVNFSARNAANAPAAQMFNDRFNLIGFGKEWSDEFAKNVPAGLAQVGSAAASDTGFRGSKRWLTASLPERQLVEHIGEIKASLDELGGIYKKLPDSKMPGWQQQMRNGSVKAQRQAVEIKLRGQLKKVPSLATQVDVVPAGFRQTPKGLAGGSAKNLIQLDGTPASLGNAAKKIGAVAEDASRAQRWGKVGLGLGLVMNGLELYELQERKETVGERMPGSQDIATIYGNAKTSGSLAGGLAGGALGAGLATGAGVVAALMIATPPGWVAAAGAFLVVGAATALGSVAGGKGAGYMAESWMKQTDPERAGEIDQVIQIMAP